MGHRGGTAPGVCDGDSIPRSLTKRGRSRPQRPCWGRGLSEEDRATPRRGSEPADDAGSWTERGRPRRVTWTSFCVSGSGASPDPGRTDRTEKYSPHRPGAGSDFKHRRVEPDAACRCRKVIPGRRGLRGAPAPSGTRNEQRRPREARLGPHRPTTHGGWGAACEHASPPRPSDPGAKLERQERLPRGAGRATRPGREGPNALAALLVWSNDSLSGCDRHGGTVWVWFT